MIRVAMRTPWVDRALKRDPIDAMEVTRMLWAGEGTLRLSALSARGPFRAIYHAPGDDTLAGKRGEGKTVSDAVAKAMKVTA